MNQREIVLDILYKVIKENAYSNILMRSRLKEVPKIKRAFITNLVNGVLRKYEILEYQLKDEIKGKTDLRAKIILYMALYERFYLKEKDYVVNNEYVNLANNKYEKSFINALLHKIKDFKESDTVCLPDWINSLLKKQYSEEEYSKILEIYNHIPEVYYRLNKNKATYTDLNKLDIIIKDENSFISEKSLLDTEEYKKGYFYIQDYNSSLLYKNLDLKEDNTFLDVCSAPGSKLFNCLDILKPENCYANDINASRLTLIKQMAERLGFKGISYLNYDGREIKDHLDKEFDRILVDAPCSGLGVIGRKPDLKFHLKPESLDELEIIQKQILNNIDPLLKKKGIMVYSTCTLNKKENEKQIKAFLNEHPNYQLIDEDTLINLDGDAFYYAKMIKE